MVKFHGTGFHFGNCEDGDDGDWVTVGGSVFAGFLLGLFPQFLLTLHFLPVSFLLVERYPLVDLAHDLAVEAKAAASLLDPDDTGAHLLPGTLEQVHKSLAHSSAIDTLADGVPGASQLLGIVTGQFTTNGCLNRDDLV